MEAHPLIVVPFGEVYVTLGGNLRLEACKGLGREKMKCVVLPENTPVEKLKEIVIKDNSSFGSWDKELLMSEWSDVDFSDWGVGIDWNDCVESDDGVEGSVAGNEEIDMSDAAETVEIKFTFTIDDWREINAYLLRIAATKEDALKMLQEGGYGLGA